MEAVHRAYVGDLSYEWNTIGEFLDKVEKKQISVNFGTEVGHGSLRIAAMGFDDRKPDPAEACMDLVLEEKGNP